MFCICIIDWGCREAFFFLCYNLQFEANKHDSKVFHPVKSQFAVAKPRLHLYRSHIIIEPKPKGRQPLLAFALLFAAIVLFVRKSSYNLSDTSITSPFLLALEAWGESAGILKKSFGLLLTASWRDIKRNSIDFSLLASSKFLYRELAGGPPCRCCFNSATQNGVGQNRLLHRRGGKEQAQKVYSNFSPTLSWGVFKDKFSSEFFTKAKLHFSADTDLEV